MSTENPCYPNFLKKNLEYVDFHRSLDNVFRKLREEGVGANCKHTPSITVEEEIYCGPRGIWIVKYQKVFFALFSSIMEKTSFSAVDRNTGTYRLANFLGCTAQIDIYMYTQKKSSKNCAGGLAQLRLEHKTVPIYSAPSTGDRCHVQ